MSGTSILRSGLVASACVAGLTLSACASTHGSDSRYGVSDYESGGDCNVSPCGPVAAPPVAAYQAPPAVIYQEPAAPVYIAPSASYAPSQYVGETADCPPGTNRSGDGTCMMSGSTSFSAPAASYSMESTYMSSGETADCPPGTNRSGDGTCLMSSGGSYDGMAATSAYSSSATTIQFADCPAGSTRSDSGSCTVSSGYVPSTTYTPPATYLPIRK